MSAKGIEKAEDPQHAHPKPPFEPQTQESPGLQTKMDPVPDCGETSYKGSGKMKGMAALVTGGDSGIGRAACIAYAREGCDLIISYLNEDEDAKQVKQVADECGVKCHLMPGDISDEKMCQQIVEKCVKEFGRLDVLVLNAAYQGKAVEDLNELSSERIMHTFKTNIISMFWFVKAALEHMKPGSAIITLGSIQAYDPTPAILDYATTKGAIVAFTKGLAQYVIKKGIRANCIAPGPIWTPLVVASFSGEKISEFGKSSPIARPGQPVEFCKAFVFLGTSDSSYVNGEIMSITGGSITA